MGSETRLAKALSHLGLCSRRDAEKLMKLGKVRVNGATVTAMGAKVLSSDKIEVVDDDPLTSPVANSGMSQKYFPVRGTPRIWLCHKPPGVITSHKDPQQRPTVFDIFKSKERSFPSPWPPTSSHIVSIGRLDLNSEGLLVLTGSKALAHALMKPSSQSLQLNTSTLNIINSNDLHSNDDSTNSTIKSLHLESHSIKEPIDRVYRVRAFGKVNEAAMQSVSRGINVNGIDYGPLSISMTSGNRSSRALRVDSSLAMNNWFDVTLYEGKNREIRKIFNHFGLEVNRLVRVKYGPFLLGDLKAGEVEELSEAKVENILMKLGLGSLIADRKE